MLITKKRDATKQAIMNACPTCKGQGCRECALAIEYINLWSNAGIPVAYWDYSLNSFTGDVNFKNKIEEYTKNIDKLYIAGKSYAFVGKFGVGKTFAACEVLKSALIKRYTALYTTMNEIIDMLISGGEKYEFKQKVLHHDFLVIDELDSRYLPNSDNGKELFATNLEVIIRTRFQHRLPIIFCSNNSSLNELFDGLFGQAFGSLFAENLITIPAGGRDLRQKQ